MNDVLFESRTDAGQRLASALGAYRGRNAIVLAIPRGAVVIGAIIAESLDAELDVVLVRKLGAPANPEFAIGAVDETGWTHLDPQAQAVGATAAYVERERREQLALLRRRRAAYSGVRPAADVRGRIAIVVDDGLATGASMIAALHSVRARQPSRLVCAVPVAAPGALERVRALADEVVCLASPADFYAVGQFYGDFAQVEDDAVIGILQGTPRR